LAGDPMRSDHHSEAAPCLGDQSSRKALTPFFRQYKSNVQHPAAQWHRADLHPAKCALRAMTVQFGPKNYGFRWPPPLHPCTSAPSQEFPELASPSLPPASMQWPATVNPLAHKRSRAIAPRQQPAPGSHPPRHGSSPHCATPAPNDLDRGLRLPTHHSEAIASQPILDTGQIVPRTFADHIN